MPDPQSADLQVRQRVRWVPAPQVFAQWNVAGGGVHNGNRGCAVRAAAQPDPENEAGVHPG